VAGLAAGNDLSRVGELIALAVQMGAGMKARSIAHPHVAKPPIGFAVTAAALVLEP
jgi:hypothetical protein